MTNLLPSIFNLSLVDKKIVQTIDLLTDKEINKFSLPLTGNQHKLYVLTDSKEILYIGTTKTSIKTRLRSGLTINGKNGYHGYKWKGLLTVKLFVWCFEELDKQKIENIEAELVFLVRKETGKWPAFQNEIHFNNFFQSTGQAIAENLFEQLRDKKIT